jgi:hypothetical protein
MDKPDALKMPATKTEAQKDIDPVEWVRQQRTILKRAAKIMGISDAENIYKRKQPDGGGYYFFTPTYEQTLQFPVGHDLEGISRYDWKPHPDTKAFPGVMLGYLVAQARPDYKEPEDA